MSDLHLRIFFLLFLFCPVCQAEEKTNNATIAFLSCNAYFKPEIWKSLASHQPEYLLFLGDNVYAENGEFNSIEKMRKLYSDNYSPQFVKKIMEKSKVYAIWDDHDFGENDSDSNFHNKEITLRAFKENWKNPPSPPGLEDSIAFKIGGDNFKILMTDDRSYKINSDDPSKVVFFGAKQLKWIEEELLSGDKKIVFLASGNTLLSKGGKHEGIHQSPSEAERLFAAMEKSPSEVVVLTGDLHFARVVKKKIGQRQFFEILSSPFSAAVKKVSRIRPDPNQIAYYDQDNNFGIIKVEDDLTISAEIRNTNNEIVIEKNISAKP